MTQYQRQIETLYLSVIQQNKDFSFVKNNDVKSNVFPALQRVKTYQQAYIARLLSALKQDHPVTMHLLGESDFEKTAVHYIQKNPPQEWDLNLYTIDFADFLVQQQQKSYILNTEKIESAFVQLFWQKTQNETIATAENLMPKLAEGIDFQEMIFMPRRASVFLDSDYAVWDMYISIKNGGSFTTPPKKESEYLYLYRHLNEIQGVVIDKKEYQFLQSLSEHKIFAQVLQDAQDSPSEQELSGWVAKWLSAGMLQLV